MGAVARVLIILVQGMENSIPHIHHGFVLNHGEERGQRTSIFIIVLEEELGHRCQPVRLAIGVVKRAGENAMGR